MQDQNISVPNRREVWVGRIEDWQKSGLTIVQYCKDNGLAYKTFLNWRRRISLEKSSADMGALKIGGQKPMGAMSAKFVAAHLSQTIPGPSLLLEHRSGWRLHLPADMTGSTLAELLRVVCN